ncbi:helix-turn-helix domain-containing protein [Streptomyces sp. NPDC015032]|uniref:helix-turn-helix domain-containing protein n=1 Tax=Streptomyces sp. NPDC015032 TaxID=3364937 RepID=UPI0036F6A08E
MRLDTGITACELAVRCGWSGSKSSRTEQGETLPGDADIRARCTACDAPGQAAAGARPRAPSEGKWVNSRQIRSSGRECGEHAAGAAPRAAAFPPPREAI